MKKLLILTAIVLAINCLGVDKKDLTGQYKDRYVVAVREGLVLAVCSTTSTTRAYFLVRVNENSVDYSNQGRLAAMGGESDCQPMPEPVRKGEVLKVLHASVHGHQLHLLVRTISPHAVTRGAGAFQHESMELPEAILLFPTDQGYDQAAELVRKWLKSFDSAEEAAKFGNTASGVFVKEVKLGMTFSEVEAALGPPQARVDLPDKVLYKYKDMTVEFRNGKVADVR